MLPHIDPKQGHSTGHRVLVLGGHDIQLALGRACHQPAPTTTLDAQQRSIEGFLEVVDRSPLTLDGSLQAWRGGGQLRGGRRGWGQVLPEERVVDVASAVELDLLLQADQGRHVLGLQGRGLGCQGRVEVGDVGLMVLLVVDFHDLFADDRFQSLLFLVLDWTGLDWRILGLDTYIVGVGERRE